MHNRLCVDGIFARDAIMMDAACGVKHNRQKWVDPDPVSKNVFLTEQRGPSHVPGIHTGPSRGLAITCGTSLKVRHAYFCHPLLTPFYTYSVRHDSIPCSGSMRKPRQKLQGGVVWCDPTVSYHEAWAQIARLFHAYPMRLLNLFSCALFHPRVATESGTCGGTPDLRRLRDATKSSTTNQ